MGTGASRNPVVGVPANPRVTYSNDLSKKEKQEFRIDAPVLVDMQHGSVRYREDNNDEQHQKREIPHEGEELDHKHHYFYHTRLNKFGPDADKSREDSFKFYYVTKGPSRAQGKKLFYVYGQGWSARDSMRVKPTETVIEGKDFAWPKRWGPNDFVYDLKITRKTSLAEIGEDWEEDRILQDLGSTPDRSSLRLKVKSEERITSLKGRLAIKLLKASANILICYNGVLLRNEDVIGDVQPQDERLPAVLEIQLTLMQPNV